MPWLGPRERGPVIGGIVAEMGPDGMTGHERQFDCDTIAMSGGFQPSSALLHQAGATFMRDFDVDADIPVQLPNSVHAGGRCDRIQRPDHIRLAGKTGWPRDVSGRQAPPRAIRS